MSDPLDDLILKASAEEAKTNALRSSMAFGLTQDPDQRAKAQAVASRLQTTPQAAQENLSNFERAAQRNTFDFDGFIKHTPRLASWTSNPENASVAHDDLDSLKELEHATQDRPKGLTDSQWQALLDDRIRVWQENKGKNEFNSGAQALMNRWFSLVTGVASWAAVPASMIQQLGGMANKIVSGRSFDQTLREGPGDVFGDTISGGLKRLGEEQNKTMGQQFVKTGPQRMLVDRATGKPFINPDSNEIFNRDLLNTVEGMPADLLGMWMTGGIANGKIFPAYMSANAMEERAKAAAAFREANGMPANPIRDYAEGSVSGALNWFLMTGMPHATPTRTLLGDALQKTGRAAVLGPSLNAAENALAGAHGEKKDLTEGAVKSFVHFLPWELQSTLPRLLDAAASSKLKARSPEAFQKATEAILKDSVVEQVMIPADRLTTFFQENGLDPLKEAERLGAKNYSEALAAGTDVVIPTADFLAKLKPEQHQALLPDLRTQVGGLTAREAEAYQAEASKVDLKSQVDPAEADARASIYEATRAQLIDAGNSERVADILADRHSRVMVNLAQRFGQDPLSMNERFGLRIYRPSLEEGQKPVDIALGRMGGGDSIARPDFYAEHPEMDPLFWQGEKLSNRLDALRQRLTLENGARDGLRLQADRESGTDRGTASEPAPGLAGDAAQQTDGGQGRRRASGLDARKRIREHASPEGVDAFLKAPTVYTEPETVVFKSWNGKEHPYLANVEGRDVFVQQPGKPEEGKPFSNVHLEVLPDGDLYVRIIDNGGVTGAGDFLYKEAIKAAMKAFPEVTPDSMVIGETSPMGTKARSRYAGTDVLKGRDGDVSATPVRDFLGYHPDQLLSRLKSLGIDPLKATNEEISAKLAENPQDQIFFQPAYHGSPYRFDKFTLDHIGKGEGAQAYGWGLYFTGSKEVADYYRERLGQNTYSYEGKTLEDGSNMQIAAELLHSWQGDLESALGDVDSLGLMPGNRAQVKLEMKKLDYSKIQNGGQTYKVDIPDDGKYLLWDKPLSKQPESVKEAIASIIDQLKKSFPNFDEKTATGKGLYSAYKAHRGDNAQAASEALNEAGVPGIKYLDGVSRGSSVDGTYNYVIFDANAVNTLETYYQSAKRRPEEYQRLRTRMASLRSLSPSHQAGELTRRALEAKAREDEFLAWEEGVKATQAGDIFEGKRGFIQFTPDRKVSIALLEKADLSTFTHEVSHMYLEVFGDLATAEGAKGSGVEDYQKILDFLGVKERGEIQTEHHEKFARAMEAYAMEGKAPTPELKTAFQRVKFWMMQVYRSISDLGVKLNDDVRGVFDRMFAGEEAVAQAQQVVDLKPLFATAEDMKATPAEFEAYATRQAKAIGSARDAVEAKLIRDLVREKEAWWKAESARVAEEVTDELDADPTYQAFKALVDGNLEDGTPIKLNKEALEAQFGKGVGKDLPRSFQRIYTREGGMDAEAAAEILGFESGDRLIESLRTMEPRKEAIRRLTEERMKATHGDLMTDGSLAETAIEALHDSAREDMKMAELRALRRMQREVKPVLDAVAKEQRAQAREGQRQARAALEVPPVQAFREAAREIVEGTSIRDLEPNRYLVTSRKMARESESALLKKDYQAAGDAKQKEILNHHLYLEATKAKAEAADIAEYGRKGETAKFQARVGKAGGDYLAQWNALASRYEFRKVTNLELDARAQSLEAWATAQQAAGEGIVIDPSLYQENQVKNWREVPISELRAVHDALKNIETVARRQRQVLDGDRKADFEEAVTELDAGARGNLKTKPLPLDPLARSAMDKVVSIAKGLNTGIVKMERVIDHLDQGDINGPWRRYLFEPMALAQFKEYELNQKVTKALAEAIEAMPKDQRHSMLDIYDIPGMGKVTRKFILSMALNWGNEGNREKMLKGMGWAANPEVVGKAFDKLNRADWEFVQKTWDAIDQLWPEIADLQRRMTGVEPPRVERQAFAMTLADGSTVHMDGGYYPLVYDRTKSSQGAMQADNDIMNSEGGFNGPVTFKGHTKERVAQFSAPLNMDFEEVLIRHTANVIKDISHREAALSVSKLIRDQRVRSAISETMGPEYDAMLMPWLKGTVNDLGGQMGPDAGAWKNMLMTTRSNMVLAGLSFRAGSVLVQATDLGRAMTRVAPRHLGQALLDFGAHPIETTQMVRSMSKEMLGRSENLDRDTRAMLKRTQGKDGWMNQVQKVGMEGLAWADTITSTTTWLGAFRQAEAEGKSQEQAVREADRTVRLTMMSSAPKDLVAVQRVGDTGMKFLTMFMGDATSAYGIMNEGVRQIALGKDTGSHLFKMAMVGMILPLLGQLIKNRGPRDDEDKAWWATRNALLSLPSSIPIARDIAQSLDSGQDYKFTPVANAIDKAVKAARMPGKLATGKATWDDAFAHAFDAAGTLGGIPGTSQIMTTTNYLRAVKKGKQPTPKSTYELLKNSLFGPPPKGK